LSVVSASVSWEQANMGVCVSNGRCSSTSEWLLPRRGLYVLSLFDALTLAQGRPGGFNPISANLMRFSMGEWLLSQRDSAIVAWHEVPDSG
jgi:hypothetical protein